MRSVVQLYPGPPLYRGAVAQLGERLVCNQEATGSIPVSSTSPMLGVNTTAESVFRLEKVAWRRTLGWNRSLKVSKFQGFKDLETKKHETLKPPIPVETG